MRFVKLTSAIPKDELLSVIKNYEFVNEQVHFDEKKGKPCIKVKEKGERLRITCEMLGTGTKDNEFLVGTYFSGSLREKDGVTTMRGIITTAPIYHTVLAGFTVFFIYQCIRLGGFNPVPILLIGFNALLFKKEYRKQGLISRYLARAFRKAEEKKINRV